MADIAAYIDGFNLYYGMRGKYGRRHLWLDVVRLVENLRPKDDIVVVRYFTAIVKSEPAAARNQLEYLDALRAKYGSLLDIRIGRFKTRKFRDCRRCGAPYLCQCPAEYRSFEEKETDVALGASMVADTAIGLGDTTVVVSADSDLAPALAELRRVNANRRIYLALPPGNAYPSPYLAAGGVGHFTISEPALRRSQLPPSVIDRGSGRRFSRPAKWV